MHGGRHSLHQSFDRLKNLYSQFDDPDDEFIRNPDETPQAFCCLAFFDPSDENDSILYHFNTNRSMAVADLVPESLSKITLDDIPINAYRIDGQEIVHNEEVTTESFLSAVKEYLQTLHFPIRTVAIGTSPLVDQMGVAAELVIIDPPVSIDAITGKLFHMLEADQEWLRTASGLLLHAHDHECDQYLRCEGCCPSSSHRKAKKKASRQEKKNGTWDRILHVDMNVEDLNALDRSDMDVVKAFFLNQSQSIQSRKDLVHCLMGNKEPSTSSSASNGDDDNEYDGPEYAMLTASLAETPSDKFDLFFHIFGLRSCAHEECFCGAVLMSQRMPFYRGVNTRVEIGSDNSIQLMNECHICAQCQSQATLTPYKICGNCHTVRYCSRDCQKQHWHIHKADCKKEKDADAKDDATENGK